MTTDGKRKLVVIGTSGSHDYLTDPTGGQRFWPVHVPPSENVKTIAPEDRERLDAFLASRTGTVAPALAVVDDGEACDGVHDESAPAHHLCTRCFPDLVDRALRGDLVDPEEDDEHEDRRDDGGETE